MNSIMHQITTIILVFVALVSRCVSQSGVGCKNAADVIFVLDGSNSINPFNYATMVSSVDNSLRLLDLGQDWTRVGVVMFSGYQQIKVIPLSSEVNFLKPEIQKLVDYPDTTSDTDIGIQTASTQLLVSRRKAVPQVMVLVTDGYGNYPDRTMNQVRFAQANNITIITVGMYDKTENQNMATDAARDMFVLSEWGRVIERVNNVAAWYCPPPDCTKGVYMMFVLDGSNSVFYTNFELTVNSIKNTSLEFWNTYPQSKIGMVVYSTTVTDVVPLTTDRLSFQERLKSITYPDQGTFTWLAINEAAVLLANSQTPSSGQSMPKVMVVITDGDSENQELTIQAADAAKQKNILIYGIGVGTTINPTKLMQITSIEAGEVKLVNNFDVLAAQLTSLVSGLCNASAVLIPKPTTPTTTITTTPAPTSRDIIEVCNRTVDVIFVMDASNSVGLGNFNLMTSAVSDAARYFLNGTTQNSQVRLITYASAVNFDQGLLSLGGLQAAISSLQLQPSGSRATNVALTQAGQDIQAQQQSGLRNGVPIAVLIVLTGSSDSPIETSVLANALLTQRGIKVFSLGITTNVNDAELMGLTFNTPGRWLRAANYTQLPAVMSLMSRTICQVA